MISKELVQCAEDMRQVAQCGKMTLDAQARAYDLLEKIECKQRRDPLHKTSPSGNMGRRRLLQLPQPSGIHLQTPPSSRTRPTHPHRERER